MKKRRLWKNAGLVALSAVMVGGAATAFTACGGGGATTRDYTLSVYIFCSQADSMTNRTICENWAKEYSAAHSEELGGNTITVSFQSNPDSDDYFKVLGNQITGGSYPDVIYVSPSQVLSYANRHILDLTQYLTASQEVIDKVNSVWPDSLSFYAGYAVGGNTRQMQHAEGIAYDAAKGFYDPDAPNQESVSIYGLPKDYSNFGLGYNRNYFSETMKKAYTTLKPSTGADSGRRVTTRVYDSNNKPTTSGSPTHTGTDTASITYAVAVTDNDDYKNPYTKQKVTASVGDPAPFINVGIPTTYKPFNFYKYTTYNEALRSGDPLAVSTRQYTNGAGYTVTIPGFPGETFAITGSLATHAVNQKASYDAQSGNIVLTWAEYGALSWACTYMLNSFAWSEKVDGGFDVKAAGDGNTESAYTSWFSGQGGIYTGAGTADNPAADYSNVYGGEQYENGDGGNLYILPWLFSNDATYISADYTKSINESKDGKPIAAKNGDEWSWTAETSGDKVHSYVGDATNKVEKVNLDGTTREALVQYGINSENFIETYGAFHEYVATWNAHYGETGDVQNPTDTKSGNGQNGFVAGASIFYGVGTWDVSEYQEVDRDTLDLGITPTAVSNKLSLYAQGRDAYYGGVVTYSNSATTKGTGANAGSATDNSGDYEKHENSASGLHVYTTEQIRQNQVLRQDKWAGRMDSVGYAVNRHVTDAGQPAWLAAAAVDLVMELTIGEQAQITLTYGGAQLPNVVSQCNEYLNYNTTAKEGAFADMITPEGDSRGNEVWDQYYALAKEMASAGMTNSTQTVSEFLTGKKITLNDKTQEDVKYDTQYAGIRLCDFTTATTSQTRIAYAMRVLRMINYTRAERDILIRMQTGMNAVRDQTLYTAGSTWMTTLNATETTIRAAFLAYRNQAPLAVSGENVFTKNSVAVNPDEYGSKAFMTPAVYCVRQAVASQNRLEQGQ